MLNAVPFIGWLLSLILAACFACPFWFFWTCCGYGNYWFPGLPPQWGAPAFADFVVLFSMLSIVRAVVWPTFIGSGGADK